MTALTNKEIQLLAVLHQLIYEIRDAVPLANRPKSLRRSIGEASQVFREISGQPPLQ